MSRFLQLHLLTVYPPSNPNRDDLGRPKSAIYGDAPRLRISSQAIKRAARLSEAFQTELSGHLGERTRRIGEKMRGYLLEKGAETDQASKIAEAIADVFGKIDEKAKKEDRIYTQLAFVSPDEWRYAQQLADKALAGEPLPETKELTKLILRRADGAADVAMFGRMLADDAEFNRDAAVQVAHALTTHRALVEDDYYTAVDDLKTREDDRGAGFVGEAGFGSGVFYLYACVNRALLVENLDGDAALAGRAQAALVEALATTSPSGKRASFAHNPRASYVLAELGDQQPRSLASAFLRPVTGDDLVGASREAMLGLADRFEQTYGPARDAVEVLDVSAPQGSLASLKSFAASRMEGLHA